MPSQENSTSVFNSKNNKIIKGFALLIIINYRSDRIILSLILLLHEISDDDFSCNTEEDLNLVPVYPGWFCRDVRLPERRV